jgi:cytoskeletal protein CcmA (bactofilin family)
MLGKSKDVKEPTAPTLSPVSAGAKTIIGEQISIEGNIKGTEDLIVEGSVKGKIELEKHKFTVGPKGQVEAEINAADITISGRLTGNIAARGKVEITKEADFNGEIRAKSISVEDGAYLKAVIELEREPEKKAAPFRGAAEQAAAALSKEPHTLAAEADKRK